MVVKISTANHTPPDREELFWIDENCFTIPVVVPPNIALKFLRDMRDGSIEKALARALDNLIGKKGVDMLAECDALTGPQMQQIMKVIEVKMLAAAEQLQGN